MGDSFIFIITYYWVYHISQADRFCAQTTKVLNWHSPTAIGIRLLRIATQTITEQCPCAHCGNCLTQPAGKIAIELRNSTRNKFRTQKLTFGRPAQLPTTKSVDHQSLGNYFSRPFRAITILFTKWQESFGKKNPDTCWLKKLENIKQASFLDVAHIPLALIRWIVIAPVKRGLLDNPPFTLMIFLLRLKPHLVRRVSRHVSLPGGSISHSLIPISSFVKTIQHHSTSNLFIFWGVPFQKICPKENPQWAEPSLPGATPSISGAFLILRGSEMTSIMITIMMY